MRKQTDLSLDKLALLLDDSQSSDGLSHNILMLVYMLVNDDVLLLQSGDMNKLLTKMYWFTSQANRNINEVQNYDWPDGVMVFTSKNKREQGG